MVKIAKNLRLVMQKQDQALTTIYKISIKFIGMKCVNATKVFCIDAIVNRKYNIDIKINCKFIG